MLKGKNNAVRVVAETGVDLGCFGNPAPGVYVDVSIQKGSAAIGFGVYRQDWLSPKTMSVPTLAVQPGTGEMEAVKLALAWFPGEQIWCDHPGVAEKMGVMYIHRKKNRFAHAAARLRLNWCNERRDVCLSHPRRIKAYVRSLRIEQTSAGLYYSGRLGMWGIREPSYGR